MRLQHNMAFMSEKEKKKKEKGKYITKNISQLSSFLFLLCLPCYDETCRFYARIEGTASTVNDLKPTSQNVASI